MRMEAKETATMETVMARYGLLMVPGLHLPIPGGFKSIVPVVSV
jgi:hypothetical protein